MNRELILVNDIVLSLLRNMNRCWLLFSFVKILHEAHLCACSIFNSQKINYIFALYNNFTIKCLNRIFKLPLVQFLNYYLEFFYRYFDNFRHPISLIMMFPINRSSWLLDSDFLIRGMNFAIDRY